VQRTAVKQRRNAGKTTREETLKKSVIADPHLPPESPVQSNLPVEDDSEFYAQDYRPTYSFQVHERVLGGLGLRWWRGGYCLIAS